MTNPGNYDPNRRFEDTMKVEVVFGQWEYRKTVEIETGGNARGMDIIDCAVGAIYDDLEENSFGIPTIYLTTPDGGDLECSDDEDDGFDWLKSMVLSARIVSLNGEVL